VHNVYELHSAWKKVNSMYSIQALQEMKQFLKRLHNPNALNYVSMGTMQSTKLLFKVIKKYSLRSKYRITDKELKKLHFYEINKLMCVTCPKCQVFEPPLPNVRIFPIPLDKVHQLPPTSYIGVTIILMYFNFKEKKKKTEHLEIKHLPFS